MSRLRMAVVGTGALGRHHARILSQLEHVELVAVADSDPRAAAETAQRCQTRAVGDCRELLSQVQAVVVAVPTGAHRAVAGEFLAAGIDVLVEKPIAASVAEANELLALSRRHGALLQVGHIERFNPALAAARPFLADCRYIRAERYAPFSFRSTDIGVVHDLMIHDLDLVLELIAAPVAEVHAFGVTILTEHEDCAQARLVFSDGSVADLSANRVSPVVRRQMQAWGPGGCVQIDFAAREVSRYRPSPRLMFGAKIIDRAREPGTDIEKLKGEIFGNYIDVEKLAVTPCDQLTAELLAFTDCVRTRTAPRVGGEAGLAAMLAAERILSQIAAAPWNSAGIAPRRAG